MPPLRHNQPAGWLSELVRQHPAHLSWDISLRAALCVGLPLSIGIIAGDIMIGLWISMGTLLLCSGESGTSTYHALIRQTLICVPIGAAGYLAGYLTLLPYPATLAAMTVISFAAAIISSYGTVFSVGSMQAMLTACIAVGLPFIGNFWMPALLFLVGAAFYILLLGLEILMDRHRPQRIILATHIRALAAFADQKADDGEASIKEDISEQARRRVTDSFDPLYAALMAEGYRNNQGHSADLAQKAAVIKAADSIFSIITATPKTEIQSLHAVALWLNTLADALIHRSPPPPLPDPLTTQSHLNHSLQQLVDAIWHKGSLPYVDTAHPDQEQDQPASTSPVHATDMAAHPAPKPKPLPQNERAKYKAWLLCAKLAIGRDAIFNAFIFALCMGVAFASKYAIDGSHWFWVPLTVALVMKPDFGSVFARAVLRTLGTAGGVIIAALMLAYIPKGQPLVLAIALLAGLLSWGKARSYAMQAVILAPLVLVLVDVIVPGAGTIDYALQRFEDTAIGGLIVIVFGYAFWPKVDTQQLGNSFIMALTDAANYLRAACAQDQDDARLHSVQRQRIFDARHLAYRDLSNIRSQLQKHMAEPPPAGIRAAAWLPIIAGAERLCDSITAFSSGRTLGGVMPDPAQVEAFAGRMENLSHEKHAREQSVCPYAHDTRNGSFLCDINSEIGYLAGLLEQTPGVSADSAARVLSENTADPAIAAAKHPTDGA